MQVLLLQITAYMRDILFQSLISSFPVCQSADLLGQIIYDLFMYERIVRGDHMSSSQVWESTLIPLIPLQGLKIYQFTFILQAVLQVDK